MSLADTARQFWSAAYFLRRAKDREKAIALKVLLNLTRSPSTTISLRAAEALKERKATVRR